MNIMKLYNFFNPRNILQQRHWKIHSIKPD